MQPVTETTMKSIDSESEIESAHLEGDIIIPGFTNDETTAPEYNTLDEPILSTITRDLKAVGAKLYFALVPTSKNLLTKEWDLWGPLFLCTYIGLVLQGMTGGNGYEFTEIFTLFWIGTACLTYNSVFVCTATISVFQNICVLGYCLGPLALAVTIFEVMHLFDVGKNALFLRFLITAVAAAWSSYSSIQILGSTTVPEKKVMVLGPVVLFYVLLGVLVLYHSYAN